MDLLRIFLTNCVREEEAVLTLETSKKAISTSVENLVGVPAASINITLSKKRTRLEPGDQESGWRNL